MAALPDVLILIQGSTVYGLDPYSLQQLWIYRGKGVVSGPFLAGERLFVIEREVRKSTSGGGWGGEVRTIQTTYHRIVEIDPALGVLLWQQESASSTARVLSSCGRVVILLDQGLWTASKEKKPSRIFLEKQIGSLVPEKIWLAGNQLVAWLPGPRIAVSFDLERNTRAWQRSFPEEIVDVRGCGEMRVTTTAGAPLLLDPRTGETVRTLLPEDLSEGSYRDGYGRVFFLRGNHLTVQGTSGAREWLYEAGAWIRFVSAAESYVALVTEAGTLEILGQSRADNREAMSPDAGGIELTVDPEDALIWLDGSYLGSGGRSVANLSPGTHRLRLVHPDRKRLDMETEVAPGRLTPLNLAMERLNEGAVRIGSYPSGAVVFVDGEHRGRTPLTLYDHPAAQILQVVVAKTGYRDVSKPLSVREDGAELSADLKFASPFLSVFGIAGRTGTGAIRGWREADILENRVAGEPYRPAEGDSFATGILSVELGPPRWRLFARGGFSSRKDIVSEGEGGLWFSVDRGLRFEVGASYLNLGLKHASSEPPNRDEDKDGRSSPDRNAPLEQWRHPIPRVFIDNESPGYWLARCRLRLRAGLLLEFGAGQQLQKERLRGTALVEDAADHLVRDPARSYDFTARNEGIVDARLQLALGTFRIWKLAPSAAVDIHYQHRWADLGPARENTSELTVGIGFLHFNNGLWPTP